MAYEKPNKKINDALYFQEAKRLHLPATYFKELRCMQIRIGGRNYYFFGTVPPFSNGSDLAVAGNKYLMNLTLSQAGIPVAKAIGLSKEKFENFDWQLGDLKFPLVAKPSSGTWGGEGVLCNIQSMPVLHKHLEACFKVTDFMSIEEFHGGLKSYRVFILNNKILGVLERFPPIIIGDGQHNIQELMDIQNNVRKQHIGKLPVAPLKVDKEYLIRLDELGLTLECIPKKGESIALCYRSNTLVGGSTRGVKTSMMCKENAALALSAAKALDLEFVGLDLACEDISKPIGPMVGKGPKQTKGFIIEANNYPDASLHERPFSGPPNHVARKVLKQLIKKHPLSYALIRFKQWLGIKC